MYRLIWGKEATMCTAVFQETLEPEIDDIGVDFDAFTGHPFSQAGDGRFQPGKPAEAKLIESALAGNLTAFNQLVDTYQDCLFWWIFSLVKDEDQADDLTQSVFISAYEKLSSFRGGSFRAWLFKIARNRSYDELRRKKRYPLISLDGPPEEAFDRLSALPDRAPLPEEALIAAEQSANIEELLIRLPIMAQQVLRLIDMEGMDYQEASQILGLPMGTIKSRLARARWKLRLLLGS
jgi:RNA polymerase sigma factor (sigma-70 family)